MKIGGLQKFSLLDYPEHLSAIIFTKGCNFRCQFCYNPMLVWPSSQVGESKYKSSDLEVQKDYLEINEDDLFVFLKKRAGKLDAVVITGGEPTMHSDLPDFAKKIQKLGYKIKLDTNGTNPDMIQSLLDEKLIDYIAMDMKAPFDKYDLVTGTQPDVEKIKESVSLVMGSGLPYEFRTTIVPDLHEIKDIDKMGKIIEGADKWFLQQFKSDTDLVNRDFEKTAGYTDEILKQMKIIAKKYASQCDIR